MTQTSLIESYREDQDRRGREGDGSEGRHHDDAVSEVSLVLVLVAVSVLTEDGTGCKPPPADLEDQPANIVIIGIRFPCTGSGYHTLI